MKANYISKFLIGLILIFSFAFISNNKAYSQEFKAGVLLGITPSQVDGDRVGGYYKVGFTGGLFVYRDYGKMSRFQGELVYSMKGSRISPKSRDASIQQVSANYIDLNILYVFKPGKDFNLRIGLTPGATIYASEKNLNGLEPIDPPAFRPFSLGFTTGLEYKISERINLVWTYNYSIISIREGDLSFYNLQFYERNGQYHNYMSFTLGYRF